MGMRLNVAVNPEVGKMNLGIIKPTYTRHAIERARDKGFRLPESVATGGRVVEAEFSGRELLKMVVRNSYDGGRDIVLVLVPEGLGWKAVTAWLNFADDNHSTLNLDRLGRNGQ